MAKRILNRKDLRADFDAAERRKEDEEEDTEEEEEDEEGDDEESGEAETEDESAEAEQEDEDEEEKPKKKKVAKVKVPKAKAKPRGRSVKITRMKVVWGVFSNSNQCVATFEYPQKKQAEDLVAKLTTEKKNTHFLQPVKEPIEEKK